MSVRNPHTKAEWIEALDALEGANKYGLVKEFNVKRVEEILSKAQRLRLPAHRSRWFLRAVRKAA